LFLSQAGEICVGSIAMRSMPTARIARCAMGTPAVRAGRRRQRRRYGTTGQRFASSATSILRADGNVSELTARTNDEGWPTVFSEWLKVSRGNAKDAIMIFSVGGGTRQASRDLVVPSTGQQRGWVSASSARRRMRQTNRYRRHRASGRSACAAPGVQVNLALLVCNRAAKAAES
jgi:hypothetical protein